MRDIALLFARDPVEHSRQDIEKIVDHLRKMRVTFDQQPAKSPVAKKPRETKAVKAASGMDLSDLGIDL